MSAKRYRWKCPSCGEGVLGPQKPRRDNVIRFCLKCSRKEGHLVERVCPALEKKRTASRERSRARVAGKAAAKEERERARWTFKSGDLSVDLRVEAKRLLGLVGLSSSDVVVELRTRRRGGYTTGFSSGGRIVLTIPADAKPSVAIAVLAHEVAHEANRADGHGAAWRASFVELAESYGAVVRGGFGSSHELHRGIEHALAVALGEAAGNGITEVVCEDQVDSGLGAA
jgi:hypothetical protein